MEARVERVGGSDWSEEQQELSTSMSKSYRDLGKKGSSVYPSRGRFKEAYPCTALGLERSSWSLGWGQVGGSQ